MKSINLKIFNYITRILVIIKNKKFTTNFNYYYINKIK